MRIVFDARSVTKRQSGVGAYAAALLQHLVPLIGPRDRLLVLRGLTGGPLVEHPRVEERALPGATKSPLGVTAASVAGFSGWDLFHSTADVVPHGLECPAVVTLHDLMWLEAPRLASAFAPERLFNRAWYRASITRSIRAARRILVPSFATASAVERLFPARAEAVRVAHHGVPAARVNLRADRGWLRGIVPEGARYALAVGQGSPYKNHAGLIRAFVEATRDDPSFRLVLVRRFKRRDAVMEALLRRPEVVARVIALPHVPDHVLAALYVHARMLVHPSTYEGFGLPVVEAMAAGTPVLASLTDTLREVAGGAALHVEAADELALARAIRALDTDTDLRAELSEAGRERAASLSWRRCAQITYATYREALGLPQAAPGARGVCSLSMAPSTAT